MLRRARRFQQFAQAAPALSQEITGIIAPALDVVQIALFKPFEKGNCFIGQPIAEFAFAIVAVATQALLFDPVID